MTVALPKNAVVVKLGGEVVKEPLLGAMATDLADFIQRSGGRPVVVVHGGGPQATALQEALGQKPIKIAGRRFTDEATLDVMKMVIGGKLNSDLTAALTRAGAQAVGLTGASSCLIEATKRPPRVYGGAGDAPIDLGLVGDVVALNERLLGTLLSAGYTPVLGCLGADRNGQIFNINADVVANRVAVLLAAESLVLVSDIRGVLRDVGDPASRFGRLTVTEAKALIADGIAAGGMIPKLEESFAAIAAGARQVHIVGRLAQGELRQEIESPGSIGTVLVA